LNVLSLIDVTIWKNKQLKQLIDLFKDFVEDDFSKNRLVLSYNPIMSIAMTCELLTHIARNRMRFENECKKIKHEILQLGLTYNVKIQDERFFESLILDTDFMGRTILKLITKNNFEPLMDENDAKAENLMLKIWHGKEATRCDGNIYGYSNMTHILFTKSKKLTGKSVSFMQIITNYFEVNLHVDYTFQYRYRTRAISFYFVKEFLCALAMLGMF